MGTVSSADGADPPKTARWQTGGRTTRSALLQARGESVRFHAGKYAGYAFRCSSGEHGSGLAPRGSSTSHSLT